MCSGPYQRRPLADVIADINSAGQVAHLSRVRDDLARDKAERPKVPWCDCPGVTYDPRTCKLIGDAPIIRCRWETLINDPIPQRAVADPPGRDISDTRSGTDNTHDQLTPSVTADCDRGTIHAANDQVSETERHDG